jgi:hypothetical protein
MFGWVGIFRTRLVYSLLALGDSLFGSSNSGENGSSSTTFPSRQTTIGTLCWRARKSTSLAACSMAAFACLTISGISSRIMAGTPGKIVLVQHCLPHFTERFDFHQRDKIRSDKQNKLCSIRRLFPLAYPAYLPREVPMTFFLPSPPPSRGLTRTRARSACVYVWVKERRKNEIHVSRACR